MNVRPAVSYVEVPRVTVARAMPELTAAGVTFVALLWLPGSHPSTDAAVIDAAFRATLVGLAVTDLRRRIIPNRVVYPALAAAIVLVPFGADGGVGSTAGGMAFALAVVLPVYALSREGLGGGDVKMAALVGAIVGFPAVATALAIAAGGAGPAAIALLIAGGARRGDALPFGMFLGLGALLV